MKTIAKNKLTLIFLVVTISLTTFALCPLTAGAASPRTYITGNYMLELDGVQCGYVKSMEGGSIYSNVINESTGPNAYTKKHISQPRYEEITLEVGFSMTKQVYEWISSMLTMDNTMKSGAIITCDYKLQPTMRKEFTNAIITEVTFPAADAASKEPAYVKIKIAPEQIRDVPVTATKTTGVYGRNEQKVWLPNNFRFNIDGLDSATSKTSKVQAITIKQTAAMDDIGNGRDYQKEPAKLEIPNLSITIAEVSSQPLVDWFNSFVVSGNNDEQSEKSGYLEFLAPNNQTVLCRLDFMNMGIFKLAPDKSEANSDQVKRKTAEFYCERILLTYGNNVIG